MQSNCLTISVKGKATEVPSFTVGNNSIVRQGGLVSIAAIHDEEWLSQRLLEAPAKVIASIKEAGLGADLFTFAQRIPDTTPHHSYPWEWDNAAVVPITTYEDWWEKRLPQESRRNVRLAGKRGVVVRLAEFDDAFVKGIQGIYDEAPVRQGKRFWHYGKDFDTVKRENGTYREQSDFIGAYLNDEMIGFLKLVRVDHICSIMQILAKAAHMDKRTTNALLAKAVEVAAERKASHLMYCKYVYSSNDESPLTEFKRRNGFEAMRFPRYYVPLTAKGALAFKLRFHHGLKGWIPPKVLPYLLDLRTRYYSWRNAS